MSENVFNYTPDPNYQDIILTTCTIGFGFSTEMIISLQSRGHDVRFENSKNYRTNIDAIAFLKNSSTNGSYYCMYVDRIPIELYNAGMWKIVEHNGGETLILMEELYQEMQKVDKIFNFINEIIYSEQPSDNIVEALRGFLTAEEEFCLDEMLEKTTVIPYFGIDYIQAKARFEKS